MRADKLLSQIDEQRNRLYNLANGRRLVDPEVVQMSQELDQLLNLYTILIKRE
ncbi:sporulation protein Spo0E [Desulfitobacterium metallireducens DSM 15288]|uniref:Sporulation protein Spo0E n=2 Tax=Desulfitobacterium TaxID=36853 RepID=W0EFM8_9FIRM|nr:sporulation protein Spo0E [Desulfitobacterium metallireducens DSM 15288]